MQHNESGEERVPAPLHIMRRCVYRLVDALNFDPRQGSYCISKAKDDLLQVHWVSVRRPRIWLAWWYWLFRRKPVSKSLAFRAAVKDGQMMLIMNSDYFDMDKLNHLMAAVVQHVMEQEQETESE